MFRRTSFDPVAAKLQSSGMSASHAQRLSRAGTAVAVRAGTSLCVEGEFGLEAFVLVSGEAIVRLPGAGRTVHAGEVIGEIAALDLLRRRTATVETTQDSMVLAYDVRTFRALADEMADVLVPDRAA